jgi:hypothetical protein
MKTPQIQNLRPTLQKLRMIKEIKLLMALRLLEKVSAVNLCLTWGRTLIGGTISLRYWGFYGEFIYLYTSIFYPQLLDIIFTLIQEEFLGYDMQLACS